MALYIFLKKDYSKIVEMTTITAQASGIKSTLFLRNEQSAFSTLVSARSDFVVSLNFV